MCADQDVVDPYWSRPSGGVQEVTCGWLKDKYGLSWQIFPGHWSCWAGGRAAN